MGRVVHRDYISGRLDQNFGHMAPGLYHLRVTELSTGASGSYKLVGM